ncbi:MAG: sigma factor, partial [Chitinophagales bacterium]
MTKLTDIAIVRQVQAGNRQAYQELMTRYKSYVYTLVMRLVKHSEEAEEVAQDVFVQAFRSLGRFEGKSKFSTWLYR